MRRNVRARAHATRYCTRLAFARATAVATHAIHAEAQRALVVSRAQAALHQLRRALVHDHIAIIAVGTLRVVRARIEAAAGIARVCIAIRRPAIDAYARAIAGIRIHLRISRAGCTLTNRSVRIQGARSGAVARPCLAAGARRFLITFVLRILAVRNGPTLPVITSTFQRRRARLAKARTNRVTTHAVRTETARALVRRGTRRA